MKNIPQKNDWIVIAVVMIAAGILLVAISANAFCDAINQDTSVARFVIGSLILLSGIQRLIQRKHDKAMIALGIMIGESREKKTEQTEAATRNH